MQRSKGVAATPTRFVELDALRGIAAMLVVLLHFAGFTSEGHKDHSRILFLLRPFLAGHEAVILFFLLSGFVLSLSTWKGSVLPYKDYFVRRLFRIYVPYAGALALAILGAALFHNGPRPTVYFTENFTMWSEPPTLKSVVQHVLFLGDYDVERYNAAFWSLIVEMRISLIFPFVCLGLRRIKTWIAACGALALSCASTLLTLRFPGGTAWYSTQHYLSFFIIGALLARRLSRQPWPPVPEWVRHAMVPLCVLLFAYSTALHRFLPGLPATVLYYSLDWPVALGALGMIYLAATHHATRRTLGHFVPRFLGHISYSLYLTHNLVLVALLTIIHDRVSMFAVFPIYIGAAIGFSAVFHRLVERPAMEAGRRLTRPRPRALTV